MSFLPSPFISICIPAYKRTQYLKRLLESIAEQTFRNFEVIVSDDSGDDDSVKSLVDLFTEKFPVHYFKNPTALGTPANWNFGIGKAKGEWIKLMHDDDWFATSSSLQNFADATTSGKKFILSAYTNHFENTETSETIYLSNSWKQKIKINPAVLIAKNVIGPPSVILVHHSIKEKYDERLKWRVDTDFYERVLRSEKDYYYIKKSLVCVGISESQVTQSCIYKPEVELPEGLILLEKYGVSSLKNIQVYDAWWRLFRNMNITDEKQLSAYTKKKWPTVIVSMTKDLSRLSPALLKKGIFSKLMMGISYLKNRKKI